MFLKVQDYVCVINITSNVDIIFFPSLENKGRPTTRSTNKSNETTWDDDRKRYAGNKRYGRTDKAVCRSKNGITRGVLIISIVLPLLRWEQSSSSAIIMNERNDWRISHFLILTLISFYFFVFFTCSHTHTHTRAYSDIYNLLWVRHVRWKRSHFTFPFLLNDTRRFPFFIRLKEPPSLVISSRDSVRRRSLISPSCIFLLCLFADTTILKYFARMCRHTFLEFIIGIPMSRIVNYIALLDLRWKRKEKHKLAELSIWFSLLYDPIQKFELCKNSNIHV